MQVPQLPMVKSPAYVEVGRSGGLDTGNLVLGNRVES
jgi:hypothetical protein